MVTTTGRGLLPPLAGGESPNEARRATTTKRRGGTIPHPPGGFMPPWQRPQAPHRRRPIDTHVNPEQRDAARGRNHTSAFRREAPGPADDTRAAGPHAPRGPRDWDGRLFCGHDAMVPFTATCAACFLWHEFRNTLLPCWHDPRDPSPSWCDVCRFYFEDLDERNGRPRRLACGQPAACPVVWGSCSHCFRASHTHGTYVRPSLLRAHAGPSGPQLPVVHGAQGPAQRGGRAARD